MGLCPKPQKATEPLFIPVENFLTKVVDNALQEWYPNIVSTRQCIVLTKTTAFPYGKCKGG